MRIDKLLITTVTAMAALTVFIGWSFYETLSLSSPQRIKLKPAQQKAVMTQAGAINEGRLNSLAEAGKVVPGMTQKQVTLALGEPASVEHRQADDAIQTIWWYEHETWMSVVFDNNGVVAGLGRQP